MTNKDKLKQAIRKGIVKDDKTALAFVIAEKEKEKLIKEILPQIKTIPGLKGEKGDVGPAGTDGRDGARGPKGLDGKNPDASVVTQEVIQALEPLIPDIKDITNELPQLGGEIVDAINLLKTDNEEDKIDAVHIKNLPKAGNNYYGGSGIKELVAGTGITIDNSNLGYPKINSTGGSSAWGSITGTLTDQTDLTTYLSTNYVPYTGATGDVNIGAHNFLLTGNINFGASPISLTNGGGSIQIGQYASAGGTHSQAIGYLSAAAGYYAIAIGYSSTASELGTAAIGNGATASGTGATAIGDASAARGYSSTGIGYGANAAGDYSICIGYSAQAPNNNEINFSDGFGTQLDIYNGVADFKTNSIHGASFVKNSGTSSQFLKADGSVDSSVYGVGTVTNVASGNGMNFTAITGTGSVTMGTPSSCTAATTNAVTATSHTHAITGFLTAVTAHNILSATHGDSVTASATKGDIIIGNATPKWDRLAGSTDTSHKRYLQSNPAFPSGVPNPPTWQQIAYADISGAPGVPAATNQVIYNNGSALAGSANFTYDGTSLAVGNSTDIALKTYGGMTMSYTEILTGSYYVLLSDRVIVCNLGDSGGGSQYYVNLPTASGNGRIITIKHEDSGGVNTVAISNGGCASIEGTSCDFYLNNFGSVVTLQDIVIGCSYGWIVIGAYASSLNCTL